MRWITLMAALAAWGCGPTVTIRHRDPTRPLAKVFCDGQAQGQVVAGRELTFKVEPGPHTLQLRTREGATPWHPEAGVPVVLDDGVVLTLLPDSEPAQ